MQGQLRGPSTEAECPIRALVRIVRPTRLKLRAKMRQRAQGPTTVGVRFGWESSLGQTDRSWLQPQPFTSPSSKSIQHLPQAPSTPPHTHKQELHHHHSSRLPSPFVPPFSTFTLPVPDTTGEFEARARKPPLDLPPKSRFDAVRRRHRPSYDRPRSSTAHTSDTSLHLTLTTPFLHHVY